MYINIELWETSNVTRTQPFLEMTINHEPLVLIRVRLKMEHLQSWRIVIIGPVWRTVDNFCEKLNCWANSSINLGKYQANMDDIIAVWWGCNRTCGSLVFACLEIHKIHGSWGNIGISCFFFCMDPVGKYRILPGIMTKTQAVHDPTYLAKSSSRTWRNMVCL